MESQEAQGYTWEQVAARKNENCDQDDQVGQLKVTEKKKTPVLWAIQWEEVEQSVLKGGGMIRNIMATKRNKKQQKRMKTDNRVVSYVHRGFTHGTPEANTKVKRLPSMFKNKVFSLVFKNKQILNWRI